MFELINRENFSKRVLYQDMATLVFNKPAGYETVVKGGGNTKYCLTSALRRFVSPKLAPCHRLDRDTSGCQLFALNKNTLEYYEELFKSQKINKLYLGICIGNFEQRKGTINKPLSPWKAAKSPVQVLSANSPEALPAKTSYRVLASARFKASKTISAINLVSFKLFTGRTHQIRVHAQSIEHPLLADDQYGDRNINKEIKKSCGLVRQALHAWKLSFNLPDSDKNQTIEAPLEADFQQTLDHYFTDWKKSLFG